MCSIRGGGATRYYLQELLRVLVLKLKGLRIKTHNSFYMVSNNTIYKLVLVCVAIDHCAATARPFLFKSITSNQIKTTQDMDFLNPIYFLFFYTYLRNRSTIIYIYYEIYLKTIDESYHYK
jgi:hypothetical protein